MRTNYFVDNIDAFLKACGKNRADLMRDLDMPSGTISNWIRRDSMPSAETIYKIARYFNCPMEYLLHGEGTPVDDDIVAVSAKLKTLTKEQRKPIIDLIFSQVNYWKDFYEKN